MNAAGSANDKKRGRGAGSVVVTVAAGGASGCAVCQYPLGSVNLVLSLVGATVTGVAIWVLVDVKSLVAYLPTSEALRGLLNADQQLRMIGSLMLALGVTLMLASRVGCAGACYNNRTLLAIYVVFMLTVIVAQLVGGAFAYVQLPEVKDAISELVLTDLRQNYPASTYITDNVMQSFECCGWNGYRDFAEVRLILAGEQAFPRLCCASGQGDEYRRCGAEARNPKSVYLFRPGCKEVLTSYLSKMSGLILFAALAIALVECLLVVLAIWLCMKIKPVDDQAAPLASTETQQKPGSAAASSGKQSSPANAKGSAGVAATTTPPKSHVTAAPMAPPLSPLIAAPMAPPISHLAATTPMAFSHLTAATTAPQRSQLTAAPTAPQRSQLTAVPKAPQRSYLTAAPTETGTAEESTMAPESHLLAASSVAE